MKRYIVFVLVILLLAVAVMAVLSVTYPGLQEKFADFFRDVGAWFSNFFGKFAKPIEDALVPD